MNWAFVRREWGAVTFVVTVLVGLLIVPIALYFGNQSPSAAAAIQATPAVTPSASPTPTLKPTLSPKASPSPTKKP